MKTETNGKKDHSGDIAISQYIYFDKTLILIINILKYLTENDKESQ